MCLPTVLPKTHTACFPRLRTIRLFQAQTLAAIASSLPSSRSPSVSPPSYFSMAHDASAPASRVWETDEWAALAAHVKDIEGTHLRDLLKVCVWVWCGSPFARSCVNYSPSLLTLCVPEAKGSHTH